MALNNEKYQRLKKNTKKKVFLIYQKKKKTYFYSISDWTLNEIESFKLNINKKIKKQNWYERQSLKQAIIM